MTGKAHVALFGSRHGAHEVLADSGAEPRPLKAMQWYTDAPPNGDIANIGSFFAGYELPGCGIYVIQRTTADPSATRPGMVATAAVLLPAEELRSVGIETVATLLEGSPNTSRPLDIAELGPGPAHGNSHPPGAAALVAALLTDRTVLWTGVGLIGVIGCLWQHMSRDDRRRFVFGAAFHPDAVSVPRSGDSLTVLVTSPAVLSRWEGTAAVSAESPPPDDPVVHRVLSAVAGQPPPGAESIITGPVPFALWPHLVKVLRLVEQLEEISHEQLRSLLQLLGFLAPVVDQGSDLKIRALTRLEKLTDDCRFADLHGLRTLPWSALEDPPRRDRLVQRWCTRAVALSDRDSDFADAILTCTAEADPFRDAVRRYLSKAVKSDPSRALKRLGPILATNSQAPLVEWLAKAIGDAEAVDTVLAPHVGVSGEAVSWVADLALRNGWPRSYAVTADLAEPVGTWRRQLALGGDAGTGFDQLATRSSDDALIRRVSSSTIPYSPH